MYYYIVNGELYHHGVKGQKWGVRRYQNPDGTLTDLGKKRQSKNVESDKKATIVKGTTLYRTSANNKTDTSSGKIYVTATKEAGDFYISNFGSQKIYEKGKAYVHEYITKTDIKLPDKKTMEKVELGLLKDKNVQKELVDSLMKKGYSREKATEYVRPYSAGKNFAQKVLQTAGGAYVGMIGGMYPAAAVGAATNGPAGMLGTLAVGAGIGAVVSAKTDTEEKRRALNVSRISYGDSNNKVINKKLRDELSAKGYNAVKDYNDRRAYDKNGNQSIIVFDSKDNVKMTKSSEITAKRYAEAYAKNYLKQHPKSKLDYNDLLKDGEENFNRYRDQGIINRELKKERERILKKAKKKK